MYGVTDEDLGKKGKHALPALFRIEFRIVLPWGCSKKKRVWLDWKSSILKKGEALIVAKECMGIRMEGEALKNGQKMYRLLDGKWKRSADFLQYTILIRRRVIPITDDEDEQNTPDADVVQDDDDEEMARCLVSGGWTEGVTVGRMPSSGLWGALPLPVGSEEKGANRVQMSAVFVVACDYFVAFVRRPVVV
ncbi:hypothetical protein BC830DRAFT_1080304 [Chytriomyces sp. MP71]|nr:hypothetical protein BC830DRAFT_1080304 [Chytriomyces sp. MP71]